MAIKFAKNFRLTLLLLTVQFAASIHGATLISRAPNDPALYALNPQAVAFHQNCMANNPQNSAETMQDFIQRAWSGALELAAAAQTRFTNTRGILGDDGDPPMSGLTHSIIDGSDPGWVQFFKLDYTASTVLYARQIWSGITGRINNNPGEGARPNSKITIICGPVNGLTPSWEDSCRDTPQGKVLAGMRSLKDQNSDTLYICPAFYQTDRFDLFKAATEPGAAPDQNGVTAAVFAKVRQLAGQQGTDAQTLLHEWTHLSWIGPTNTIVNANVVRPVQNPPEVYGWFECATLANDKDFGDDDFVQNADSYAWYGEYGYFKDRLGYDHWPNQGPQEKPVQPT